MTILVVGSTGTLGGMAAEHAQASGERVIGMVRDRSSAKANHLTSKRIPLRVADLKDTRQVDLAVKGIDAVIMTATATLSRRDGDSLEGVDGHGLQNLITACIRNGVKNFVFVSFSHGIDSDTPLSRFKRAAERRLENSALESTILLPSYFPEKFMSPLVGFDLNRRKARIYGDGTRPISYVATDDVARVAAICAGKEKGRGFVPMGGPQALNQLEVLKLSEGMIGSKIETDYLSLDEIEAAMKKTDDPLKQSHLGLYRGLALGDMPSSQWSKDFNVEATTVETCLNRMWQRDTFARAS